jgi:pyruvate kinase
VKKTSRELNLVWGVSPIHSGEIDSSSLETRIMSSIRYVRERGLLSAGDQVVVVSSSVILGDEGLIVGVYDVDSVIKG